MSKRPAAYGLSTESETLVTRFRKWFERRLTHLQSYVSNSHEHSDKEVVQHETNEGILQYGTNIEHERLVKWLSEWFQYGYLFVTRADSLNLARFESSKATRIVTEWPEGRVFNECHELRWQAQAGGYTVWLLGEQMHNEEGLHVSVGPWRIVKSGRPALYLWGKYDQDWSKRTQQPTWIEVRIAQPLHYPLTAPATINDIQGVTSAHFARLTQVDYVAPNGAAQFTRLVGFESTVHNSEVSL